MTPKQIEATISMLERTRNKKGQIDPRWILIIFIIILLILLLRAKGMIHL